MAQAPLTVKPHLSFIEIESRYKTCKNPRNKTRWQLIWLMTRPEKPLRVTDAAESVGYCERWARLLVGRYNAGGADTLIDQRKNNKGKTPILDSEQIEKLKTALTQERPPDGGLWTGPKVAQWIERETKTAVTPQGAWFWLRKIAFTLHVPRPAHTKSASPEERDAFKKNSKKPSKQSKKNSPKKK